MSSSFVGITQVETLLLLEAMRGPPRAFASESISTPSHAEAPRIRFPDLGGVLADADAEHEPVDPTPNRVNAPPYRAETRAASAMGDADAQTPRSPPAR